jgi:hypothetical protein
VSAIGSYEVLDRTAFATCLDLARQVRSETTGKWIFKSSRVVGLEQFTAAWNAAVRQAVDFGYSGYVLGNYLDAQEAVNGRRLFDEQSEIGGTLARVFTAGFVFDAPVALPELPADRLAAFCRDEYGEDASEAVPAIMSADAFYRRGLAEITPETLVVFVIR